MAELSLFTKLTFTLVAVSQAAVAASWPPSASYVTDLGLAKDTAFSSTARRDGGGGGYVNGFHLVGFCDSTTRSTFSNDLTSFAHNTFAYMGYRNQSDPTDLTDFGTVDLPGSGSGSFSNMFAAKDNESEVGNFAIWATGNYVSSQDDKQAIGVMNALAEGVGNDWAAGNQVFYNTMVAINVTDPRDLPPGSNNLTGERIVPRLFYSNENLYGSFTLYRAFDGYLYLFGTSSSFNHGINVARTPFLTLTDRNTYTYWNGGEWSQTQPDRYDASANIFNFTSGMGQGPNTGEVFFSQLYNTTLCVFTDTGVDGSFFLTYPTNGDLTGPWADPVELYTPPPPTEDCESGHQWNYAGHAYPDYDPSGKTLLLSWSSCESWIHMATVVWSF